MASGALLALTSGCAALLVVAAAPSVQRGDRPAPQRTLPVTFVPNRGQTDARVRYQANGAGHGFFFTDTGARMAFVRGARGAALELGFVGAATRPVATGRTPGRVNYLIGKDARGWNTGLPTYGRLVYRDLWPGVDLSFHGAQGRLKYELLVRPGARIDRARLAWRGTQGVSVARDGSMRLQTRLGVLHDQRPVSYQQVGGSRVPVQSRFVLAADGSFGFALGRHDPNRSVVVDPGLVYSTLLGGAGVEQGRGVAVDSSGRAIATGLTTSTDYPTVGAFDTTLGGGQDAYVTRLNAAGSGLEYSTYLGGSTGVDTGRAVSVDSAGNAFVTGDTGSTDFPVPGGFDTTYGGSQDAFAAKLDGSGALVAATYVGGSGSDQGFGIAVDATGAPTLTGVTASPSGFPTTPAAFDTSWNGLNDAFVTKLDPALATLGYSTFLGGSGQESGQGVALDAAGNAVVTGVTASSGFPTTAGAFDTTANGLEDVFVTKLDATGSALLFSTFIGSSGSDQGFGVALDSGGSPVVTGYTGSSGFPTTPGAYDTTHNGAFDVFATKLDAAGAGLTFSTFVGGAGNDQAFGIALDGTARPTLTGTTFSSGYPATPGAYDITYGGNGDVFATRLAATGASLVYSTFLGGSGIDNGFAIAASGATAAFVTGYTFPFGTTPFPTTAGAFDTTPDTQDAFVTKLDLVGAPFAVTLLPATGTNEVDVQHCVTATVTDFGGQPVPGVTVRFSVSNAVATHATPSSGAVVTAANGQAQFCYTARLPGQNTIHAFADSNGNTTQDAGEPFADATKTWTLPPSNACEVSLGGSIVTAAGDPAQFGGDARLVGSRVSGRQTYVDQGPAQQPPITVRSRDLTAISCSADGTSARIFGTASINNSGTHLFRIDVTDSGQPGTGDTYGIIVSTGYASGQQPLTSGNVLIHR